MAWLVILSLEAGHLLIALDEELLKHSQERHF